MKNQSILDYNVRDWYVATFPEDEKGQQLDKELTVRMINRCMLRNDSIYSLLLDSVIRERVFSLLAYLFGVRYEVVYTRWLNGCGLCSSSF